MAFLSLNLLAAAIGYSREAMSRILHGKTPITPKLALHLEQAGIGKADFWLKMQMQYDVYQLRSAPQTFTPRVLHPA